MSCFIALSKKILLSSVVHIKLQFVILSLIVTSVYHSQALNSLTGLYTIPSADLSEDGIIKLGAFILPKQYVEPQNYTSNVIEYFGSLTFLPFVEMSLKFTKPIGQSDGLGDRMLSIKIQPISESANFPSVAIGVQDFFHATESKSNRFNSLYFVATKNLRINHNLFNSLTFTLGYGTKLLKAGSYQFLGLWGGLKVQVLNSVDLMIDNDSKFTNSGIRIKVFDNFFLIGGYVGLKYFSGGGGIKLQL